MTERDVVLIDMDCFYVQVEQRLNPSLKGKPCAVVQYKTWKGGGIIAVGYEARKFGVTRNMRGDDAKQKCPDIQLARVPEIRGKADLTRYREAGAEVISVFSKFCSCVERASVDEAYLDITSEVSQRMKAMEETHTLPQQIPNTFVEGYEGLEGRCEWLKEVYSSPGRDCECRLAVAASIVEEMRTAVFRETGFTCSAGISHNKMLAKLACGRNKPNKQTVLPLSSVPSMFEALPIPKIRHLGGKLGAFLMDDLHLQHMGDLLNFSEQQLQEHCGHKTGSWLYHACRGIESEPVATRELPKSIGCSKNFRGKEMLDTKEKVKFWLSELSKEVTERLEKDKMQNKRVAKSLTVHVRCQHESGSTSSSRACLLAKYDHSKIASDAFSMVKQFNTASAQRLQWSPPLTNLGLSACKFTDEGDNKKISSMFYTAASQLPQSSQVQQPEVNDSEVDFTEEESASHLQAKVSDFRVPPTSPKSIGKTSKLKSTDKDSQRVCSIKSFFSQKVSKSDESEKLTPTKKTVHNCGEEGEEITKKTNVDTPITGFFASKMKLLSSVTGNLEDSDRLQQPTISSETICSSSSSPCDETKPTDTTDSSSSLSLGMTLGGASSCEDPNPSLRSISATQSESVSEISSCKDSSPQRGWSSQIQNGPQTSLRQSHDYIECDTCSQMISAWEMPEHNDYHFALKLQKEVNKTLTSTGSDSFVNSSLNKRKGSANTSKSPRDSKRPKGKTNDRGVQPLTAFFSKS